MMDSESEDREAISFMLIGLLAAAASGAIVGAVLGISIMWLAAGGS